jgi:ferredoxin
MQEKMLAKKAVNGFLERLISQARTIAPVKQPTGQYLLKQVVRPEEVGLDCPISYYSAKEFLVPSGETLFRFGRTEEGIKVEPVRQAEPTVLFGLHPCDANAIRTYDAIFKKDNEDEHYLGRRKEMAVVAINCLKSCDEFSFCRDMKTMSADAGFDLMLTDLGDAYFVQVATDRGAELLGDAPNASAEQKTAFAKIEKEKAKDFNHRIEYDTAEIPKRLEESYDSLIWDAASRRCYNCGSCVLVCPTCYCFDVSDKLALNLTDGERQREWDGCMLEGFAEVAGGENFRPDKSQRLRHRLFRKGKFIRETYDLPGCVGCGRCERSCTSKVSIVATYNQLKGGA